MAVEISYPGVYVEEMSSGAHPIEGVPTSIATFIGVATAGSLNQPTHVRSHADFERLFGQPTSPLSDAVRQFFENGGGEAWIVRVAGPAKIKEGLLALDQVDLFNLLCIPPLVDGRDIGRQARDAAAAYCAKRRALFIVDPSVAWRSAADAIAGAKDFMTRSPHAALFLAPCGAIAGLFARSDATHGVWKAPAGSDAVLKGVGGPALRLSEAETGELGALGINDLRAVAGSGTVVWGARTFADPADSDWKYIPVRRLASFIEESIARGTRWVATEANEEATWSKVRSAVNTFLLDLFRRGAFPGRTPKDAFFVKCDRTTMTQADIDTGRLVITVGFAPLKPAEFVIIRIQQLTRARALFAGGSGAAGKRAAEELAHQLGRSLYRIDLAALAAKYVDDTERQIGRLFDAAERDGAVLLVDEADGLFAKRSSVKDAHDRYANKAIDAVLRRLKSFDGLAILATRGPTPDKPVGEGTPFAKPPLVVEFPKRQARRRRLSP